MTESIDVNDAIERLRCVAFGKPVFFDPPHAEAIYSAFSGAIQHIEARSELYTSDYDCLMGVLSILKPAQTRQDKLYRFGETTIEIDDPGGAFERPHPNDSDNAAPEVQEEE